MKTPLGNKGTAKRKTALSSAEKELIAELVADGRNIQEAFRPEPLYKQTGKGHYESKTVEEVREAKKTSPKGKQP